MKESKKFFDDNRLNKGYRTIRESVVKPNNDNNLYAKYKHVLPPLEIVEQYEESYPGAFEKLFNMAKKEQDHRHAMELLALNKHHNAANWGRFVVLILGAIAFLSALLLFIIHGLKEAVIFSLFVTICIATISYFSSKTLTRSGVVGGKFKNKSRHHRNRNFSSDRSN
jgi:uncharacterized membrane protein